MTDIAAADRDKAFASAKSVVERRINLYGLTEPVVQQTKTGGNYRIIVEIPGVTNVNQAIDLIGRTAQLAFYEESTASAKVATPSSWLDIWPVATRLTGKNLKRSEVTLDQKPANRRWLYLLMRKAEKYLKKLPEETWERL